MNEIDFSYWLRRWSTWLAGLAAGASAGLASYALMPKEVQALMPNWLLATLGGIAVGAAVLVPIATSIQQKNLPPNKNTGTPPAR